MAESDASAAVRETALRALSNLDGRPLPPELASNAPSENATGAAPGVAAGVSNDASAGDAREPGQSANDKPPRVLYQTQPRYPQEAFVQRIEGTVMVEALVDDQGRVARSRVLQSVPGLDEAALLSVREWRFQPAMKDGKPVATIVHVPFAFRIYNEKETK